MTQQSFSRFLQKQGQSKYSKLFEIFVVNINLTTVYPIEYISVTSILLSGECLKSQLYILEYLNSYYLHWVNLIWSQSTFDENGLCNKELRENFLGSGSLYTIPWLGLGFFFSLLGGHIFILRRHLVKSWPGLTMLFQACFKWWPCIKRSIFAIPIGDFLIWQALLYSEISS